jgi:hypothetical protein
MHVFLPENHTIQGYLAKNAYLFPQDVLTKQTALRTMVQAELATYTLNHEHQRACVNTMPVLGWDQ